METKNSATSREKWLILFYILCVCNIAVIVESALAATILHANTLATTAENFQSLAAARTQLVSLQSVTQRLSWILIPIVLILAFLVFWKQIRLQLKVLCAGLVSYAIGAILLIPTQLCDSIGTIPNFYLYIAIGVAASLILTVLGAMIDLILCACRRKEIG